jgi:AraC-like DNA-binding protein
MTLKASGRTTYAALESGEMYVPGGYLLAYIEAARSVDLEPYRLLRQARLPTAGLDGDDLVAPQERFIELLDLSATVAQRPDFAFCVLRALGISAFGPVGLLASAQATLGDAMNVLCRQSSDPRRRMRAVLEHRGEETVLRLSFKGPASHSAAPTALLSVGVALRAVQTLLGEDWRPTCVAFSALAPADEEPYRQMFGDVAFDQPINSMVFPTVELSRKLPSANPGLARLVGHYLNELRAPPAQTFDQQVRELIAALLPRGLCTIERVAQHLGVDRRTVHRRLADHNLCFSALVHEARVEVIAAELRDHERPIATLATALGFSCNSTFSRWFRHTYGVSATKFRKAA